MDMKATGKNLSEKTDNGRGLRRRSKANKMGFRSNKRLCRPTLPDMPDELVLEILVRLPVKSLLRFKSVCKTWHATISDPCFIGMHLQRSVYNHQRLPSFLITPHFLDDVSDEAWPTNFSNNVCFYRWQAGQESANLVCTRDFQGEFGSVYKFAHCNGLVLLPTDTKMYVLNPATRELVSLPESPRRMLLPSLFCRATVGFGLDTSTNKYKVVQCFCHSSDEDLGGYSTGMEVFTVDSNVSSASWRNTVPPYPIKDWQTAYFFKGSLFWILHKLHHRPSPKSRLLRFCLQQETFSFTMHPPCPALDKATLFMNELNGELCLAQSDSSQRMVIWMTNDGVNPQWDRRYIFNVEPCLTIAISPYGVLLKKHDRIFQYKFQSHNTVDLAQLEGLKYYDGSGTRTIEYTGENFFFFFDMLPYTESLVPIAGASTNDDLSTIANYLEFPEDENEFNGDLSDWDGCLSEDPECLYYSDRG